MVITNQLKSNENLDDTEIDGKIMELLHLKFDYMVFVVKDYKYPL